MTQTVETAEEFGTRERPLLKEQTYDRWVREEGIPVASGFFLPDLNTLPLAPWPRKGGLGSFVHLDGSQEALVDGFIQRGIGTFSDWFAFFINWVSL